MLDVSPSSINVQFNPTTNALTYHLSYTSHPFDNLLNQTLQVDLDQGGVTNASLTGGQLSLIPTVTVALTFGINLTPLGSNFPAMTTQTLLSSLNGGTGIGAIGTSNDFNVILSDGTSYPVSLINPAANQPCTTVEQIINVIETATHNRVQVAIDSLSQKSLDVTQLPNTPIALDFNQVPGSALTTSTTLASLNAGTGIGAIGNGLNDLQVTLTNGTSFDVSLSQAVTIGDLINAIQSAAGGQVHVSINSATRTVCSSPRRLPSPRIRRAYLPSFLSTARRWHKTLAFSTSPSQRQAARPTLPATWESRVPTWSPPVPSPGGRCPAILSREACLHPKCVHHGWRHRHCLGH